MNALINDRSNCRMYLYYDTLVNLETSECDYIVEWSDWRESIEDNLIDRVDSIVRSTE